MKQKLTKKNLLIVLVIFILVALSTCSGKREVATPITEPTVDVQKTVEYYVAQTQAAVIPPTATQRPKPTATEEAYCPEGKTTDDVKYFTGVLDEIGSITPAAGDEPYLISVYLIQAKGLLSDVKSRSVTPCMEKMKSLLVSSLTHFVDGLAYMEAGNISAAIPEIGRAVEYMEMMMDEVPIVRDAMTP